MRALDKEAQFASALERHRDALYRVCCAYVRDESDRQDIYQEVLIHLWKSLDGFRGESNLGTWMYRVAVNTCLGWLRHEERRSRLPERAREEQPAAVSVMGAGGAVAVHHAASRYLNERAALLALGGYLVFFVALCVFALVVSLKDWRQQNAELLQEILRREQELQNG